MKKFLSIIQNCTAAGMLLLAIVLPTVNVAAASADSACTDPGSSAAGVHSPTGADAGTFTYQCSGQYTGDYTNAYYVYYPSSNSRSPLYSRDYQYDCTAGKWTMVNYAYSPASGSYYATRVNADTTPSQATDCPVAPTSGSGSGSANSGNASGSGNGISNTGNGSTNTVGTTNGANVNSTNNNGLSLDNGLTQVAGSGNASVNSNTVGGSATSGNAQNVANIVNLLQSSSNAFGPNVTTFTANINGDVTGDFMFDPSAIMNTGANSTNTDASNGKLTVNQANNTDASINNNINVGSQSGDASVNGNTKAGDATSGDASTIVNLMNVINSSVNAGKSFIGTININGNLNGDILLPQNLLDEVLAASGANSKNSATTNNTVSATSNNNTDESINNTINTTATSGAADVSGNTQAGSATSGDASNNITLLNLTGSQVVGADDLLVFVNVLGHWVGMIMNAPAGSTAASLGGGITNSGANSTNGGTTNSNISGTSNNNTNLGINNVVNASAKSGDASVTDNTIAGNAKSGSAKTAVNVLNMANSTLNLSNWFGVLFINVFGDWTGSFGVNTSAGNVATTSATPSSPATATAATATPAAFARFVAGGSGNGSSSGSATESAVSSTPQVLGTAVAKKVAASTITPDTATHASYLLPAIGVSVAILMLVGERVVTARKSHKA